MKKFVKQQLTYISFYFLYNKENITKFKNVVKWVKALESGKYTQSRGKLYDTSTGGYCCLGVGAKILNASGLDKAVSIELAKMTGLKSIYGVYDPLKSLIQLNDINGKNFQEIAEVIKSSPKGLFIEPINKMVKEYYGG